MHKLISIKYVRMDQDNTYYIIQRQYSAQRRDQDIEQEISPRSYILYNLKDTK